MSPRAIRTLGFVGLGVMGEPMCRNLARKSGLAVVACDTRPEPLQRLKADGVRETSSAAAVAEAADLIFLSLPGGEEVRAVCLGPTGLVANAAAGQIVVDLSTCQ
ncbi:MAG TPA: NAD(P)-binding domain-containing protein, partial [Candidatus Cybelea sp.]|nr:NAD(P)-binding domain-containing protein [Candidatus Cybelea sp.]